MSRLIRNKKLIGSTSNDSSHIIYDPSDTSRSETTVKSELDRLNAGVPAVDVGTATTDWTDTASATGANQGSDNYATLNAMSPASTIKSLLGSIKSLLFGLSTQATSMNARLTELERAVDVSIISPVAGFSAKCTVRNGIVELVGQTPNGSSRTLGVLQSTVIPTGNYFSCTVSVPGTVDQSKNPTVIINPTNGQIELNVNGSLTYGIYFRAMWMLHS